MTRTQFSLIGAAPSDRLLERLRLMRHNRGDVWRCSLVIGAFAWLPIIVPEIIEAAQTATPVAYLVRELDVHVRFVVTLPLMFLAERILAYRSRRAAVGMRRLMIGAKREDEVLRVFQRTSRLRDSSVLQLAIVLLVIGVSVLDANLGGADRWPVRGQVAGGIAHTWYAVVALPVYRFFLLLWLSRAVLWTVLLARFARLRPPLIAVHPDRGGGVGFLAAPVLPFAITMGAVSATLSAHWWGQMYLKGASLESFYPLIVVWTLISLLFCFGPYVVFVGPLYRLRRRARWKYWPLAENVSRTFESRWLDTDQSVLLDRSDAEQLVSATEIFRQATLPRLVPFGYRQAAQVVLFTIVPLAPVLVADMSLHEIFQKLAGVLLR